MRAVTGTFGVNLFAPNPVPVNPTEYRRYRDEIRPEAERFGADLPDEPVEDDDHWGDKIDVLLDRPVPVVSFTFGLPDPAAVAALRRAGSILVQTVTSAAEARRAADAGVDVLIVQSAAAGGHSGTFTPDRPSSELPLPELLAGIDDAVGLPTIAAGGVTDPADVATMIASGARAVMVGTALLLAPEAGTSAAHRRGLVDHPPDGDHRDPGVHRTPGAGHPEPVHRRPPRPGPGRLPRPAPPDPPPAPGRRSGRRPRPRRPLGGYRPPGRPRTSRSAAAVPCRP